MYEVLKSIELKIFFKFRNWEILYLDFKKVFWNLIIFNLDYKIYVEIRAYWVWIYKNPLISINIKKLLVFSNLIGIYYISWNHGNMGEI